MCSCTKLIWFQLEIGAIVRHSKANRKTILADVPGEEELWARSPPSIPQNMIIISV
jgi:hypothetical protein